MCRALENGVSAGFRFNGGVMQERKRGETSAETKAAAGAKSDGKGVTRMGREGAPDGSKRKVHEVW